MFKKLLSNLSFNPSLIGKVGFYAKRLNKEASVRRLGIVFIVVSMMVQVVAAVAPSESTLARSGNDVIPGGFSTQGEAVNHCNANRYKFKTILAEFGVSCTALYSGKVHNINSKDYGNQLYSMGRTPYGKRGEVSVSIAGAGTLYMRPLSSWDTRGSSTYKVISGNRSDGTPFMILFSCGNLTIVGPPRPPAPKRYHYTIQKKVTKDLDSSINTAFFYGKPSVVAEEKEIVRFVSMTVNDGTVTLNGALYDELPAGLSFVSGRWQKTSGGRVVSSGSTDRTGAALYILKPGEELKIDIRARAKFGSKKELINKACTKAKEIRDKKCATAVVVPPKTPPPPPVKSAECSYLSMSVANKSEVKVGSSVTLLGQASGQNVNDTPVKMTYKIYDDSGKLVDEINSTDLKFDNNGVAKDNVTRVVELVNEGTYTFKLKVTYGNKTASGSETGSCVKTVEVKKELPCVEVTNEDDVKLCLILSKKAQNETQNVDDANGTVAKAGDIITYSLFVKNTSNNTAAKGFVVEENISDVLEYANVVDLHGGKKDDKNVVSWPAEDIDVGATVEKKITVQVKDPIPQTPVSSSNPGTYDCVMTNVYSDTVNIKLKCGAGKTTEQITTSLPNTGPGETLAVAVAVTVIGGYFLARARLMAKELSIVKADYAENGGN